MKELQEQENDAAEIKETAKENDTSSPEKESVAESEAGKKQAKKL